ncbi:PQQ-dependent sugar dehydrogenase [Chelatococcus sp. SYSU_G07232]|uniref:PQQ-dependent sugar dehydrogenase n=1 Tax=Chelatococcus albus TaxID=3047466 RepID=A0ABT7AIS3_9HYPH|nr:PQQ-dependent sugar dehydrogenase [Chelatococcus sp. SYSU_G07232]MDJ1159253.1 PQQ-dependent sugar dehydrogenase [Chelatococcus sp. SYSU_G07232]
MRSAAFALAAALVAAIVGAHPVLAQALLRARTEKADIVVETLARGLEHPWGLAFLPDGRMLVTERPGRLRIVTASGQVLPALSGVPRVAARGQGGLLDVALDPRFAENRLVYLTYAEPRSNGLSGTTVARGHLNSAATGLEGTTVIFRQEPGHTGGNHFGSRLAFTPDGTLFVTLGDRFTLRDKAQDLTTHLGKIVRVRPDGSVPPDNPFVGREGARPEIWSYGHRNVQGAALHPSSGELWAIEHGPRGGDEVNIARRSLNYGWPVITYGIDYSGAKIGIGTAKEGMEQPIFYWDPSIAPSGAAFYTADRFPGWRGSLFTGALAGQMLVRLELAGNRVTHEERMLEELGERIRDVRQGPDGLLYLLTDADDGRILRLRPAGAS